MPECFSSLQIYFRRPSTAVSLDERYRITAKTGDRPRAGTDANVYLVLHSGEDLETPPTKLYTRFHNEFNCGQTDVYTVKNIKFEEVLVLEIWKDAAGWYTEWNIDTITIEDLSGSWDAVFPVFRGLWAKVNLVSKREQRSQELKDKRELYVYSQLKEGFPVQANKVPPDEQFSFW
ncbi:lipoxygenase homology domain-containing protein 1-like [Mya arenaria]|uniref:lipoxygenase homology domain-containing protein 1-like n=1 Tax=Mya arenaria TaxID=6604 RepID=UPI0022E64317|nr:lipoxygenase homology domain-containing protein 1-like [Mya arenaria]